MRIQDRVGLFIFEKILQYLLSIVGALEYVNLTRPNIALQLPKSANTCAHLGLQNRQCKRYYWFPRRNDL